jgi:rod shape-determining protein MreC
LKAVPRSAVSYVTARVIANSGGAFVRMILINAGTEDRVGRGQAVITGEGLIGRLTEVGDRASRVLLITDLNSRIPVTIEGTHVPAVLAGDNSERPRLLYVPTGNAVKVGDRIVTSGEGGVFPPGLPIGVVSAIDGGGARVEPYVELSQLGYVMVVDYGLTNALPQPLPMLSRPNRRAKADAVDGLSR